MRPTQWVKNGLLFAGLVFGARLLEPPAIVNAAVALLIFCLLSSGLYLINDARDAEADREHPLKRLRPVASGELSPTTALTIGAVLVVISLAGAGTLGWAFFLVALSFAALMVAYNLGLKEIVIVDVLVISLGFVLRAIAGAVAVAVPISSWLLACTLLLALFLGVGKRRFEFVALQNAGAHRRSLTRYSLPILDRSMAIAALGAFVAYSLYSFEGQSAQQGIGMAATTPLVGLGIARYFYLLHRRGGGGAPEATFLSDRMLLLLVAAWGLLSVMILYWT